MQNKIWLAPITAERKCIMSTKKVTKREMFEIVKSRLTNPDEIAFIDHEIELLSRKTSAERKPTATQVENMGYKESILATMEAGVRYTIHELMKVVPNLPEGFSSQRMSAIVTQLKNDGFLVREVDEKRRACFVKAE